MKGGSLFYLVLLVVVPCLAANCTTEVDRGEVLVGERKVVDNLDTSGGNGGRLSLFVVPQDEFQGVSVEGVGSSGTTAFWFPFMTHIDCFIGKNFDWWQLEVLCTLHKDFQSLWCYMMVGKCRFSCLKRHTTDLLNVRVVAYGPSKWKHLPPPPACRLRPLVEASHTDRCWEAPPYHASIRMNATKVQIVQSEGSTRSSSHTLLIVVGVSVSVVIVVLIVVVAVVVVKVHVRRLSNNRSGATPSATTTVPYRPHEDEVSAGDVGPRRSSEDDDSTYESVVHAYQQATEVYEEIKGVYLIPLPSSPRGSIGISID